jgi:hypothetical protein
MNEESFFASLRSEVDRLFMPLPLDVEGSRDREQNSALEVTEAWHLYRIEMDLSGVASAAPRYRSQRGAQAFGSRNQVHRSGSERQHVIEREVDRLR